MAARQVVIIVELGIVVVLGAGPAEQQTLSSPAALEPSIAHQIGFAIGLPHSLNLDHNRAIGGGFAQGFCKRLDHTDGHREGEGHIGRELFV